MPRCIYYGCFFTGAHDIPLLPHKYLRIRTKKLLKITYIRFNFYYILLSLKGSFVVTISNIFKMTQIEHFALNITICVRNVIDLFFPFGNIS